jgi:hypothetical protein
MANSYLNLTSLDFDTYKNNLKSYLKSQSTFVDYDFEGSNMNVLLSVLSYNTYLNAFYLNMVASESFLDTAQLRDSVVSRAKELNYIPQSYKSPKALINASFVDATNTITNRFEIPKGAQFSGINANGGFSFVTDRTHILKSDNNVFTIQGLEIYEGQYINETYVVDDSIEKQQFILSNFNVDIDSINVTVSENGGVSTIDYSQAQSLFGLKPDSPVFFIQAFQDKYEIVFGDGFFGRRPINNSTILVTYRITQGTDGGGVTQFNIDRDLGAYNGGSVLSNIFLNTAATAGANAESIESIRFKAPRHFKTQERAIINDDYKTLILDQFPEIKSLHVYGGEEADTPGVNYGKIYISPITYAGSVLSQFRKQDVVSFIKEKMTLGLTPVITDPNILYVRNDITVVYDPNKTNYSPSDIQSLTYLALENYNNTYLKDFNIVMRFSQLTDVLQNFDGSIISNSIVTSMKKYTSPPLNQQSTIETSFHQQIVPGTIFSSEFLLNDGVSYTLTDYNPFNNTFVQAPYGSNFYVENTSNILYLKSTNLAKQIYIKIGSIDYTNGLITSSYVNVVDFRNTPGIAIYAESAFDDIFAKNNDLIELDMSYISQNITVNTP